MVTRPDGYKQTWDLPSFVDFAWKGREDIGSPEALERCVYGCKGGAGGKRFVGRPRT